MEDKILKVGIIGFGFIGKVHAYGHMNMPLFYDPVPCRTRITHICTSRPETGEKGKTQTGAEHAVTDFKEITENPDIDIVHVCTPNHLHKEALLSAIAHNKHIYCDKPLVKNATEAAEIEQALAGYTGTAQMTLQNRFFPATIRAKQLVDEGFLGDLLEFRGCYLHSGSADPDAPLKWKLSKEAGGGVIPDLASHILDLIGHVCGDYESISAAVKIAFPERPSAEDPGRKVKVEAEDCVMMLAKMKNGALGTIEASKIATGAEDDFRFELHGSKGGIRYCGTDADHLEIYETGTPDSPAGGTRGWTAVDTGQRYGTPAGFPGGKMRIGWLRSHLACLYNFLEGVGRNHPVDPGLDRGCYIQNLIEKVQESADRECWITVAGT